MSPAPGLPGHDQHLLAAEHVEQGFAHVVPAHGVALRRDVHHDLMETRAHHGQQRVHFGYARLDPQRPTKHRTAAVDAPHDPHGRRLVAHEDRRDQRPGTGGKCRGCVHRVDAHVRADADLERQHVDPSPLGTQHAGLPQRITDVLAAVADQQHVAARPGHDERARQAQGGLDVRVASAR